MGYFKQLLTNYVKEGLSGRSYDKGVFREALTATAEHRESAKTIKDTDMIIKIISVSDKNKGSITIMENKILQLTVSMPFGGADNTVHPTLLCDEQNKILVDCGFIGALPVLEKDLQKHGLSAEQITGLVLTHHDHDHMGAAAALKRKNPSIKIYASEAETPSITASETPLRLRQAEEMQKTLPPEQQGFGRSFCDMLRKVEPVKVDSFLHDGNHMPWCGGSRIVATPGHTPGHISLLIEKYSIIITGDAMALEDSMPVIANPQFALNLEQADMSMKKLLSLPAKAYYCYHGGMYYPAGNNSDSEIK